MLLILHNQHSLLSKLLQSPQLTTLSRFFTKPLLQCGRRGNQTICESRKKRKVDFDPLITDYFKVLDEIQLLAYQKEKLSRLISQCGLNPYSIGGGHGLTPILRQMLVNTEKNVGKYPTQRRHSELLKKFATVLFIYSGPLCYEFLHQNMSQALPSLRSVQSIIHKVMDEGKFRFNDLARHIANHNAPISWRRYN